MKETYIKPTIFIERFSLTQNIASGCAGSTLGTAINSTDINQCAWDMGGVILFTSDLCAENGGIQLDPTKGDTFEGVCFNAPNSSLAPFATL